MTDKDWQCLLMLASVPIRQLDSNGLPINTASACIVEYRNHRVLLTVQHATGNDGRWAIEMDYDETQGAHLYQLGALNYVDELRFSDTLDGVTRRKVDFAYVEVPSTLRSYHLQVRGGRITDRIERVVLLSDLDVRPQKGIRYGFAGHVKPGLLPGSVQELHMDLQIETGLQFEREEAGYYIFSLDHSHPGHVAYKGCSGAPVLSEDGDLVGLVCGPGPNAAEEIEVLPLVNYRSCIDAAIEVAKAGGGRS